MKKIAFFILLSLSTSVCSASDSQILIGGEFTQTQGSWNDYTSEREDSFGLRLGIEDKKTRIYALYSYLKTEDFNYVNTDFESHRASMNFSAKTKKYYGFIRSFAGMHLGLIYSTWNLGQYVPLEDEDDLNLVFGGQGGIIIDVIDNAYLEAGYRYSITNAGTDSINPGTIQTFYGALNFKF
jgi:opacity protein-like surface antigen